MSAPVTASSSDQRPVPAGRSGTLLVYALIAFALLALFAVPATADDGVDLAAIERAFSSVTERIAPSVVGIRVKRRYFSSKASASAGDAGLLEQLLVVNGSGVIIDADGLILTNEHVIQSAAEIEVALWDGDKRTASLLSADPRSDLAVLRIDRKGLTPAAFADWTRVRRGQWALAIGNPYGLGSDGQASLSTGIISNLGRRLPGLGEADDRFYSNMIQTTAAINPGNSGGALFNLAGEVVGLITAMHTRAAQSDGVGFAIPMSPIKRRILERLMTGESIEYGFIGLSVRSLTSTERLAAKLSRSIGAIVIDLDPDGPAARAELRVDDVLLGFDATTIESAPHLAELIGAARIGARSTVRLQRDQRELELEVTIARRDISRVNWMRGGSVLWRGMRLSNLDDQSRQRMRVASTGPGVVVVDVLKNSPAGKARIEIGDVVEQVAGQTISDVGDFRRSVQTSSGSVELHLRGAGRKTIRP